MGVKREHLTPDELARLAAGAAGTAFLSGHVAGCPDCQSRLREMVKLREAAVDEDVVAERGVAVDVPHLDDDDLRAFACDALGPAAGAEVRDHLRRCRPCQARQMAIGGPPEPSHRLTETLRRIVRPWPALSRWRVEVRESWDALSAAWHPWSSSDAFGESIFERMASLGRMRVALGPAHDESAADETAADESAADESAVPPPASSDPFEVDLGPHAMIGTFVRSGGTIRLLLHLAARDGSPVPGVEVSARAARHESWHERTDRTGTIFVPVGAGTWTLRVGDDPAAEFVIEIASEIEPRP